MELCCEHARVRKNLSIEGIAEQMGIPNHWNLYKWMENGRMPAVMIRPFENATGRTYVTQWIATSAHKLVIDIPNGAPASDQDLLDLNQGFNDALNLLAKFYKGEAESDETIAALSSTIASIAGHRENVSKHNTPELGLFDEAAE